VYGVVSAEPSVSMSHVPNVPRPADARPKRRPTPPVSTPVAKI
jgi:hypothetical protein